MSQVKCFGKLLFGLISVAAHGSYSPPAGLKSAQSASNGGYMKRFGQKLSASVLLLLVAASVSTAAYAVRIQIFVNDVLTVDTTTLPTPKADAPGPGDSGAALTVTIPGTAVLPGNYPVGCTPGVNCKLKIYGPSSVGEFSATASVVLSGGTTISTSTGVLTKLNTQGVIQYTGSLNLPNPGTIEIVTSNKFVLPTGVWTTPRTGSQDSRGGIRCGRSLATSAYTVQPFCTLDHDYTATQQASCSFCRSYDATDQGDVYRPTTSNPVGPASNVTVALTSEVRFFNTNNNEVRGELVGGGVLANPPSSSGGAPSVTLTTSNSHFYLSTVKVGPEQIPCEPSTTGILPTTTAGVAFTCANNERKINKLRFTGLQPGDKIDMPTTSTDLGASDPATLAILINAKFPIDVQPVAAIANTDEQTQVAVPYLGSPDSNWNPTKTSGKRQVLAFNTYDENGNPVIDACNDLVDDNVTLSVAGSAQTDPESSVQAFLAGTNSPCIGRIFTFDYETVNFTIPGETPADKFASCEANPRATLTASGLSLSSTFVVQLGGDGKKGGKPQPTYVPPQGCVLTNPETGLVTCTSEGTEAGGTQLIECCTSCG